MEAAVRGAYDRNLLSMQDINQAVRRSFATRIRLGMFNKKEDDPFANPDESLLGGSDHADLSRQAGREAIVLLKNEEQILPISPKENEKIAVIGPLANEWFKDWNGGIPPYRISAEQIWPDAAGVSQNSASCAVQPDAAERYALAADRHSPYRL